MAPVDFGFVAVIAYSLSGARDNTAIARVNRGGGQELLTELLHNRALSAEPAQKTVQQSVGPWQKGALTASLGHAMYRLHAVFPSLQSTQYRINLLSSQVLLEEIKHAVPCQLLVLLLAHRDLRSCTAQRHYLT